MRPVFETAQHVAVYAVAFAEAILLVRLLFLGFQKRAHYPLFVLLLSADLIQTMAVWIGFPSLYSAAYWWFWSGSETVLSVLQVIAAREVCMRIRDSYPDLGRIGKEIIEWSFAIALLISIATLFFDVAHANWQAAAWSASLVLRRAISTILALALFGVGSWARWAPDPVPPNLIRHAHIFGGYFATSAIFSFLIATKFMKPDVASACKLGMSALWFSCWIWSFRRKDEQPRHPDGNPEELDIDSALDNLRELADQLRRAISRLFQVRSKRISLGLTWKPKE
jgi:hypothetical protein